MIDQRWSIIRRLAALHEVLLAQGGPVSAAALEERIASSYPEIELAGGPCNVGECLHLLVFAKLASTWHNLESGETVYAGIPP